MAEGIAIHWFRQDLRLSDNPALTAATKETAVLPIYILDDHNAGGYALGAASRWWLRYSLQSLDRSLGGALSLYCGDPVRIIADLAERYRAQAVFWNRCYEPWRIKQDRQIEERLRGQGIRTESFNGSLLWEPWQIQKEDGRPYKVFTPFYRKGCLTAAPPRQALAMPPNANWYRDRQQALAVDELKLLPSLHWRQQLEPHWDIGEEGAQRRFRQFLGEGLGHYREGRNLPAKAFVSRLSPHLHFGEISPNQLWHTLRSTGDNENNENVDCFCSQLGWREFSYSQLYYNPELPRQNLQSKFDRFPWRDDKAGLLAWQRGESGIPMVDAGMRELLQTGYIHNRIRMITGSFLAKNLLIHWRYGERWFWDHLVDADLANNSASWQWIAGCGADAAPYFRIFNPVAQGQRFDPQGSYLRRFLPELAALPDKYLFSPWEAPKAVLKDAGVALDVTYPRPIVDLKASRLRALEAFHSLRQNRANCRN